MEDVIQLHLAERASPFAVLIPESETSKMLALHQNHLIDSGQDTALILIIGGRIHHILTIGQ